MVGGWVGVAWRGWWRACLYCSWMEPMKTKLSGNPCGYADRHTDTDGQAREEKGWRYGVAECLGAGGETPTRPRACMRALSRTVVGREANGGMMRCQWGLKYECTVSDGSAYLRERERDEHTQRTANQKDRQRIPRRLSS